MIRIDITGLKDGQREIEMNYPVEKVEGMFDEFFGEIEIDGIVKKTGNRFTISIGLFCKANLICDISAEEFTEEIETTLDLAFVANTERFYINKNIEKDQDQEKYIHDDDNYIDITKEVVEQLAVSLPMKRVAPAYRGKDFSDLHPEISADKADEKRNEEDKPVDERWSKLKNLKLN